MREFLALTFLSFCPSFSIPLTLECSICSFLSVLSFLLRISVFNNFCFEVGLVFFFFFGQLRKVHPISNFIQSRTKLWQPVKQSRIKFIIHAGKKKIHTRFYFILLTTLLLRSPIFTIHVNMNQRACKYLEYSSIYLVLLGFSIQSLHTTFRQ